ncbi:MAG: glycosyl hydrolase 115 family protein [Eubacterium sp.]|nr:glycosyl hydrolase 115 family protein [Eubacterium sp.]
MFLLDKSVSVTHQLRKIGNMRPVELAIRRLYRDMDAVLEETGAPSGGQIVLTYEKMPEERYRILISERQLHIFAGDELGFVYALLRISEVYLGVKPFWFWNDQRFEKKAFIEIPLGELYAPEYRVRFRGWFVNDEVLLSHWDAGVSSSYPWEMAFEALLRLGGNTVIPGTDHNSKIYADLASDMGLWITHHHAEPLGAEMFARAYPELEPSFRKYPELFRKLWKEGIDRQKNRKVIWNLGFRGQGDCPFWEADPEYDTPEKRGVLISAVLREQYEMVKQADPDAVCCTNLYGEVMELYRQGVLSIPEDVILIWADNGYGKMVSRRQGNHNPRIPALPETASADQNHGTYYHVSFYDLQAANHMTLLPNSMEFVERELEQAYACGIRQLWLINCSNVKPHVYALDFVADLWKKEPMHASEHREAYVKNYYGKDALLVQKRSRCISDYAESTARFGGHEDERAGEQFSNYLTRHFIHAWMKNGLEAPCEELFWCVPEDCLSKQIRWYEKTCGESQERFEKLLRGCEDAAADSVLWEDSILLQVRMHAECLRGAVIFCKAYDQAAKGNYIEAFFLLGQAADHYEAADAAMRLREHDKWKNFYANDCLTDIKETAYLLRVLMSYVRVIGDGPDFYLWQREVTYSPEDKRVVLLTNLENHMTDAALYEQMKHMQ